MVIAAGHREPSDDMPDQDRAASEAAAAYEQLQEVWPAERPSRKRRVKHGRRRRDERQIRVRGERLDSPDTARMSRALLAAQRELTQAQAEKDARTQATESKRTSGTGADG